MAYMKDQLEAKRLRKWIKAQFKDLSYDWALITRKSINACACLWEIIRVRKDGNIKGTWARLITRAPSNKALFKALKNGKPLKQLFEGAYTPPDELVDVLPMIKHAGLESLRHAVDAMNHAGAVEFWLDYSYRALENAVTKGYVARPKYFVMVDERGKTTKYHARSVGEGEDEEKERELEVHRGGPATPSRLLDVPQVDDGKRIKTATEKSAGYAIEWAQELSEWTNSYSQYYLDEERKLYIRSAEISIYRSGVMVPELL